MKNKAKVCKICNNNIYDGEQIFYFTKLPAWHSLSDLTGVFHIDCIKSIDKQRKVSKSLADIYEAISRQSKDLPLISRDGNIVLRANQYEKLIEIYNFEDFCEISISIKDLKKIQSNNPYGKIAIARVEDVTLEILKNGRLVANVPFFQLEFSRLTLPRLKDILENIDIEKYFK